MTAQMSIGLLSMLLFNLVDTFYVSMLGTLPLAALTYTFPVILVIGSLSMGIGTGTSALLSIAIGKQDFETARRYTNAAFALTFMTAITATAAGWLSIDSLFTSMGANQNELILIKEYMQIWYSGLLLFFLPMTANNVIRATGDMKSPSIIMGAAVVGNIIFDPLLIFGFGPIPRLEMQGAAVATLLARSMALVAAFWILRRRNRLLCWQKPYWQGAAALGKKIMYIALPSIATNMILPLTNGLIVSIVATYGSHYVAGFGVATRIESLALSLLMALSAVLGPFIGQNLGAGNRVRITAGLQNGHALSLLWGVFVFVLFQLASYPVVRLFSSDERVIALATAYLSWVSIAYGFQGVILTSNTALNVFQRPLRAMLVNGVYSLLLYIPIAHAASAIMGIEGIILAAIVSKICGAMLALFLLRPVLLDNGITTPAIWRFFGMPSSSTSPSEKI